MHSVMRELPLLAVSYLVANSPSYTHLSVSPSLCLCLCLPVSLSVLSSGKLTILYSSLSLPLFVFPCLCLPVSLSLSLICRQLAPVLSCCSSYSSFLVPNLLCSLADDHNMSWQDNTYPSGTGLQQTSQREPPNNRNTSTCLLSS